MLGMGTLWGSFPEPSHEGIRLSPKSMPSCTQVWDTLPSQKVFFSTWWSVRLGQPCAHRPLVFKGWLTLGRTIGSDFKPWLYHSNSRILHRSLLFRALSPPCHVKVGYKTIFQGLCWEWVVVFGEGPAENSGLVLRKWQQLWVSWWMKNSGLKSCKSKYPNSLNHPHLWRPINTVDCVLENVGELTASRQGGDLLEIESKGICWVCDVREVHSHGGGQSSQELKSQMQGRKQWLQVAVKVMEGLSDGPSLTGHLHCDPRSVSFL